VLAFLLLASGAMKESRKSKMLVSKPAAVPVMMLLHRLPTFNSVGGI
jgi:hypothetical protein